MLKPNLGMVKVLVGFCFTFFFCNSLNAQSQPFPQPDPGVDVYFDDGIGKVRGNALYLSATALIHGSLEFSYERKLTEKLSVELSGGPMLFKGVPLYMQDEMRGAESGLQGVSYGALMKWYFKGKAIENGPYYSIGIRQRNLTEFEGISYSIRELLFLGGGTYQMKHGIGIDLRYGLRAPTITSKGISTNKDPNYFAPSTDPFDFGFWSVALLQFKIGYFF